MPRLIALRGKNTARFGPRCTTASIKRKPDLTDRQADRLGADRKAAFCGDSLCWPVVKLK